MNIKLIKQKWMKYYKRGFITGLFVISFICFIDQILQSPFFFNKIESMKFTEKLSAFQKILSEEKSPKQIGGRLSE